MKNTIRYLLVLAVIVLLSNLSIAAQTTEFTYQGYLNEGSAAANGDYDFEFGLFDSLEGGSQIGSTLTRTNVLVSDGVFTVKLDFGNQFSDANRYLEIGLRPAGQTVITTLAPRQLITSTPFAVKSLSADTAALANNATNATTANNSLQLGGIDAGQFVLTSDPRLTDPRPPTTGSTDYIQNTTTPQTGSNFNISGTGNANILNATTQYNIGGDRVLSVAGSENVFVGKGTGASNSGDGNVFIGSSAGAANTSGILNLFAGQGAGLANTTGSYNLFVGSQAGASNTTSGANSFVGSSAGNQNTEGSANSFFGDRSGFSNTTGEYNVFVGAQAGRFNTIGANNSFFGDRAGYANLTGSNNTAVGYYADFNNPELSYATALGAGAVVTSNNTIQLGRNTLDVVRIGKAGAAGETFACLNAASEIATCSSTPAVGNFIDNGTTLQPTSNFNISGTGNANIFNAAAQYNIAGNRVLSVAGTSNIFVGQSAGASNTGTSNTFVGYIAGQSNTSGNGNSFFGRGAGASNTITNDNSFFGYLSGASSTGGVRNSYFGMSAGYGNTTGDLNVFLGGYAGDANTTGSSNTAVGYDANFASGGLQYATAVGAKAQAQTSNQVQLGRDGFDSVRIGMVLPSDVTQGAICIGRGGDRLYQFMWCDPLLTEMEDIKSLTSSLEIIEGLRPITFSWRGPGYLDVGLVPKENTPTKSFLFHLNEEGKTDGVKYDRVGVILVSAVQEQQRQIRRQEEEIESLKSQLAELKQLLCDSIIEAAICK